MKKVNAPLIDKLSNRADRYLGFHTPGHQRGRGLSPAFSELLDRQGAALDLTELPDLDHLANPHSCIKDSQEAMANLAGAACTYYLINGATAGLEAALLAASNENSLVCLPAHAHVSLHHGLVLSGARPYYLPVRTDVLWGLPVDVPHYQSPDILPSCQGLVSVGPTYQGILSTLKPISQWKERHPQTFWLADEAHGAHLSLVQGSHRDEWPGALLQGATFVVQSTHKTLGSLTQTALLHSGEEKWREPLQKALNLLQSSSPSYLLLASLDGLQSQLQEEGSRLLARTRQLAREVSEEIGEIEGYRLWQADLPEGIQTDPSKLVISALDRGWSGYELGQWLAREQGIDVEMATHTHVLLMMTVGHGPEEAQRLVNALKKASRFKKGVHSWPALEEGHRYLVLGPQGSPELTPREVYRKACQWRELKAAAGYILAEHLVPYPPGIPLAFAGMALDRSTLDVIRTDLDKGRKHLGLQEKQGETWVKVLARE